MRGSTVSAQVCLPSATTVAVCVCVSVSSELCVDRAMEWRMAPQDQKLDDENAKVSRLFVRSFECMRWEWVLRLDRSALSHPIPATPICGLWTNSLLLPVPLSLFLALFLFLFLTCSSCHRLSRLSWLCQRAHHPLCTSSCDACSSKLVPCAKPPSLWRPDGRLCILRSGLFPLSDNRCCLCLCLCLCLRLK